jgi:glycogen phosphorylase
VTPRRWLLQANPALAQFVDAHIGSAWRGNSLALKHLATSASDADAQSKFLAIKQANKARLAERIAQELGIKLDTRAMFSVQIKRIHEYKRQLLNVLQVIARYQAILAGAQLAPRVVLIAGKAASAYRTAKHIIRLIHDVAGVINNDARIGDQLKLVFVPNYGVSWAELMIPAADLSEQISTAGTEASGTGNMKFALNGACTIGTWDGANIEMAQAIGESEFFEFGLRAEQVDALRQSGYRAQAYIEQSKALSSALDAIASGSFSPQEPWRYAELVSQLRLEDRYMLAADFDSYLSTQAEVDTLYQQPERWAERALRNIAGMGWFSVDRTVAEYVERVWSPGAIDGMFTNLDAAA